MKICACVIYALDGLGTVMLRLIAEQYAGMRRSRKGKMNKYGKIFTDSLFMEI